MAEFEFDKITTIITGKNGSGKTNLLEAISVLLTGASFRASDSDMIKYDNDWWRIYGNIDGRERQLRYHNKKSPAKQLLINEKSKRFSFNDKLPVVLFEPNDLLFVTGSPSRRRDIVDSMLSSLSKDYKITIAKYDRVLAQRNMALKKYSAIELHDRLFVWDVSMARYAEIITEQRADFVISINSILSHYYSSMSGKASNLKLVYRHSLRPGLGSSGIMKILSSVIGDDIERRTSTKGPHRDDFVFELDGSEAKLTASRGEIRTSILALKLAYRDLLQDLHETEPVILLDDVFSELDEQRRHNLLDITGGNQVIITDTRKTSSISHIVLPNC